MKFRKLRITWTVFCGIACVLLFALWVRSYRRVDELRGRLFGQQLLLGSKKGFIAGIVFNNNYSTDDWHWEVASSSVDEEQRSFHLKGSNLVDSLGIGWYDQPRYQSRDEQWLFGIRHSWSATLNGAGLLCRYCVLVLVTASLCIVPWIRHLKWRFSLQTLLLATTLVAVVLGLIEWAVR
jgi:hypothetical protein